MKIYNLLYNFIKWRLDFWFMKRFKWYDPFFFASDIILFSFLGYLFKDLGVKK